MDRIGDAKKRKATPLFSGCINYFPNALLAVAELSRIGNDQHNPGTPLHWDRSKSGDELDALARHLIDAGTVDTDGVRHSTKLAWRALANLQKEIERARETMKCDTAAEAPTAVNPHSCPICNGEGLVLSRSGGNVLDHLEPCPRGCHYG